jgi:lipopolysaccharide transport system ATP-binding protein
VASWPFRVAPLEQLPEEAHTLDVLLVGGGDIIRFDPLVALGYGPGSSAIHHPTGFWLGPILIAHSAGVPVAWNAPGVPGQVPDWARALMRASVMVSDYVNVRDRASRDLLATVAPDADITVVPDSCFNIDVVKEDADDTVRSADRVDGRYLVVQSSREALSVLPSIRERCHGSIETFVLTPVGPVTGDRTHAPPRLPADTVFTPPLAPHDLLALIARSMGVVGTSLHLTITAIALQRPAFRPASANLRKYGLLEGLNGIEAIGAKAEPAVGARPWPSPDPAQMSALRMQLSQHWDRIATLAAAGRRRRRLPAESERQLMDVWQRLPGALEQQTRLERVQHAWRATRARLAHSRYNPLRG